MKCHLCQWECEQCGATTHCTIYTTVKGLRAEVALLRRLWGEAAEWLQTNEDFPDERAIKFSLLAEAAGKEGKGNG